MFYGKDAEISRSRGSGSLENILFWEGIRWLVRMSLLTVGEGSAETGTEKEYEAVDRDDSR